MNLRDNFISLYFEFFYNTKKSYANWSNFCQFYYVSNLRISMKILLLWLPYSTILYLIFMGAWKVVFVSIICKPNPATFEPAPLRKHFRQEYAHIWNEIFFSWSYLVPKFPRLCLGAANMLNPPEHMWNKINQPLIIYLFYYNQYWNLNN